MFGVRSDQERAGGRWTGSERDVGNRTSAAFRVASHGEAKAFTSAERESFYSEGG